MKWPTLALPLLASLASTQGPPPGAVPMMRFECSQLVIDRIDPLVNPGLTPSPHLHQIVGGNSFNATLQHDLPTQSTCTSCTFSEDFSNYWTAVMYFKHTNGSFTRVSVAILWLFLSFGLTCILYRFPKSPTISPALLMVV